MAFLNRSTPRYPTIRQTLALAGVPSAAEPAKLTVLERMGSYSGRRVNFFRAFDPARAAASSVLVAAFRDLDEHEDLLVGSGHVEHEGLVMLDGRPEAEGAAPTRSPADRSGHADDERFVFQPGGRAGVSSASALAP
jgi:hypothetical protein